MSPTGLLEEQFVVKLMTAELVMLLEEQFVVKLMTAELVMLLEEQFVVKLMTAIRGTVCSEADDS